MRLFITNITVQGTFIGMSESREASKEQGLVSSSSWLN
jgi:hypothetical protein